MSSASDKAETKTGELLIFDPKNLAVFNEFESQLDDLEVKNNQAVFDYADEQGNKEARSHVHNLRKSKAAIEEARKGAKKQSLDYGRAVDAKGTELKSRLEEMIDVHHGPIIAIEEKEKARIEKIQERLQALRDDAIAHSGKPSAEIREVIEALGEIKPTEKQFSEFLEEAKMIVAYSLSELDWQFKAQKLIEDDAAELDRLRQEKAEKEQKDREEQIRNEERLRGEEKAEAERVEAAEKVEREQKERDEAEQKRIDQAAQDLREANERTEKAAQDERDRVAQATKDAEEVQKKRDENERIRGRVIKKAAEGFKDIGFDDAAAFSAVSAIVEGKIPGVTITF